MTFPLRRTLRRAAAIAFLAGLVPAAALAEDAGSKRTAALAAALGLGFQPAAPNPYDIERSSGVPGVGRKVPVTGECETQRVRQVNAATNTTKTVEKQRVCH